MDFWRAYRVLARRKWIIVAATILTTALVGIASLFFLRAYDGVTGFGPTDQAVRNAMSVSGAGASTAGVYMTSETRTDEARRIAAAANAPNTVTRALWFLALAPNLKNRLAQDYGVEMPSGGGEPDYEKFNGNGPEKRGLIPELLHGMTEAEIKRYVNGDPGNQTPGVKIPAGLWGDMLYLDALIDYYNIPKDFLKPDQLAVTSAKIQKKVEVSILDPRDITLSVRDRDPRLAEILADAITATLREDYNDRNLEGVRNLQTFYQKRFKEASKQFRAAQEQISTWRQQNKQLFLPEQIDNAIKKGNDAQSQMEGIQVSLKSLDAQIAAKKARLASLPKMLMHETKVEDPEIASLRAQMANLESDLAAARGNHTENAPDVVLTKAKLASVTARFNQVKSRLIAQRTETENPEWTTLDSDIAGLEQNRKAIQARLSTLQGIMGESAALLAKLPDAQTKSQILGNNFASAGEALNDISKKMRQAEEDLQGATAASALQVAYWAGEPPGTDGHPLAPAQSASAKRTLVAVLAAFLLGLLGSAAIILGLDFMDTSIKTPVDVERMLEVPVNGIVPRLEGPSRGMLAQVTHALPSSPHAESYRFLSTDILLSANGEDPFKSIMVATAKPGQGGTSTICNLAISLAQAGQSVALVDADLRRPSLHRIFSLNNDHGLTTVLENGRLPSDVLQRTEVENLYVMTGGPQTENAWKLLHSPKMKDVILDLSRDFDFVLFDTPSAVVFADAATLATMVDGVLLVVRAHESPTGSELQVKNLLNKTKARIIGVVLNDMPAQQVDSARFFNHYYAHEAEPAEVTARAAKGALPKGRDTKGRDIKGRDDKDDEI